ncbi:hypothetical protein ACB092_05G073600 [Castanea dentata]
MQHIPWLYLGDFNEISLQHEKVGGAVRPHNQMQLFCDIINKCGFMDLGYVGPKFTWCKHFENGTSIWERLDKGLATNDWFLKSPDHCPILVVLDPLNISPQKKPFRFEEMWLSNPGCEEIVQPAWNHWFRVEMDREILAKVEKCGNDLIWWNKNVFGDVKQDLLLDREARMWAQRSRLFWAIQGDKNTKYFHNCATKRYRKNQIVRIKDEQHVWKYHPKEMLTEYYQGHFTLARLDPSNGVLDHVPQIITEEMNASLARDFMECKSTVDKNVTSSILSWLNLSTLPHPINHTFITLIPKTNNPEYSAFTKDRLISDNILVAFETLHCMHKHNSGTTRFMAHILDMKELIRKMGFNERFITLTMICPKGFIQPSRGIRQGDLLSPFLFLLCTEGLNGLIKHAGMNGDIHGFSLYRSDDSLLFCRAAVEECGKVLNILESKTTLFFSKSTLDAIKSNIKLALGVSEILQYKKYLGLPSLVERVWKKLQGWEGKLLSQARREVLIKFMIQAIPTYTMGSFKIPLGLYHDIESLIHWMRWDELMKSKLRFFPNCSIMEATNLRSGSYAWRSILKGRDVLQRGARWQVGNGKSIKIWQDYWLPRKHPLQVVSYPLESMENATVSTLINAETRQWDEGLIDRIFEMRKLLLSKKFL